MYFVWSLLPIILFIMAIWAWLKPVLKVAGREDGNRYFMMSMFCTAILILSILIDKSTMFQELVPKLSFGFLEYRMVCLFIYPAMLYIGTLIWDKYDKKKKTDLQNRRQY